MSAPTDRPAPVRWVRVEQTDKYGQTEVPQRFSYEVLCQRLPTMALPEEEAEVLLHYARRLWPGRQYQKIIVRKGVTTNG